MLKESIEVLRDKLEKQIKDKEKYTEVYKTSVELDQLIIKYYLDKTKGAIKL